MENIYLIGFMGVGKTAVSYALEKLTGYMRMDTDEQIARQEKRSIPEIFEAEGEAYFRRVEGEVFGTLRDKKHLIVSCGGGAATIPQNVEQMKQGGIVVLLTAEPRTIYDRVRDNDDRPLLKDRKSVEGIEELLKTRIPAYEMACDIRVSTDDRTPRQIAAEIVDHVDFLSFI